MYVLITGSRTFSDRDFLFNVLDKAHAHTPITHLVLGDCPTGVDKYAHEWAIDRNVHYSVHVADWNQYGKAAGPKRNTQMVENFEHWHKYAPDIPYYAIAFTDKALYASRGTNNCIKQVLELTNAPVRHFQYPSTTPQVLR